MNSDYKKINGWINLNKPEGISSSKCVIILKKILNVKKIGHAGTLDPLASGVLPIAIGEATKSIRFISDENKSYTFNICWGVETSTDDKEGTIIKKTKKRPKKFTILQKIEKFIGDIDQRPPIYSAIKINGKRAYNIARSGKIPEIKKRRVTVFKFILKKKVWYEVFTEIVKDKNFGFSNLGLNRKVNLEFILGLLVLSSSYTITDASPPPSMVMVLCN